MMPTWLQWIINFLFGGNKQSGTDQALGKVQQSNTDLATANKDDQRANEIDQQVSRDSDAELDDELRNPDGSNRSS
jgi:hypothetical protein